MDQFLTATEIWSKVRLYFRRVLSLISIAISFSFFATNDVKVISDNASNSSLISSVRLLSVSSVTSPSTAIVRTGLVPTNCRAVGRSTSAGNVSIASTSAFILSNISFVS